MESKEELGAVATICPICDSRYGDHNDAEMRVCFPALVEIANADSYVRKCFLHAREGDHLFTLLNEARGPWVPTLEGYAIVPIGTFNRLVGWEVPEQFRDDPPWKKNQALSEQVLEK